MLDDKTLDTISKLEKLNALWIKALGRGEVDANALRIFLMIATRSSENQAGVEQSEIFRESGLSEAAVSRNIAILSRGASALQAAPDLIRSFPDPKNRRKNLLKLTDQGRTLIVEISEILRS